MPEEINRILADHAADYLFAPTPESAKNLKREGIAKRNIFVVGNTIVDVVYQNRDMAKRASFIEKRCGVRIAKGAYILVTAHRPENVDLKEILRDILRGLGLVHKKYGLPIIFSLHPRTKKMLKRTGLSSILAHILAQHGIHMVDPVSYLHQIWLLENARLVITDSGGIQEECCILKVPCVTVRMNTERPETVRVGGNIIAGTDPRRISACVDIMMKRKRRWANPFGDGKSAERIINTILSKRRSKEQAS
jgi:UDP-N-acetylglucosamine 2-epimerase (non-hydrolysing)